jgi:[acyl-carrier-protein] S-malonyltransferase
MPESFVICHMFPGQPVSRVNWSLDDASFTEIAAICLSKSGFDLLTGEASNPKVTENMKLQLYGVCQSIRQSLKLAADGSVPDIIAEHSMGIYPALAACGALSADDAIEMTFRIGMLMADSFSYGSYSLASVIGLPVQEIQSIANNHGVYLANCNTSRHVLLAGSTSGIESAGIEAQANGAFSVKIFDCDAPLHTPMMEAISGVLKNISEDYHYSEPAVPLMGHILQKLLNSADIPEFIWREISLPVFWNNSYHALKKYGVTRFIEIGAGQSLFKFNRWIESES